MRGAVTSYVALLRGINVGGSNLIRMAALKACFEAKGFRDVTTYIQRKRPVHGRPRQSADADGPDREGALEDVRIPIASRRALVRADEGDCREGAEGIRSAADGISL
jgi:hypothetical protein